MTDQMIRFFGLREGKLQVPISLFIEGKSYPAIVRWARIDRSRPAKLKKEDLPERDVIQFQWKGNEMTIAAMRVALQEIYEIVKSGHRNTEYPVKFIHLNENQFIIIRR